MFNLHESCILISFYYFCSSMPYIILILYLASALALQLLTGSFPVSFFSFPLNLIIAFLWFWGVLWLWKAWRKSSFVSFFLSKGATLWAIVLFLLLGLVLGLSGMRNIADSWVIVAFMLYFLTVLLFVILRGWRLQTATGTGVGTVRWRFLLNHAGLFLALSSAFWGAPDSDELRVKTFKNVPAREAHRIDGTSSWVSYELLLNDFNVDVYKNGVPSMYEADMIIDGRQVTLKVNHPYSPSLGENIYLVGYDSSAGESPDYCILQIVREPWKYGAAAGIIMMLAAAFMMFIGGPEMRSSKEGR